MSLSEIRSLVEAVRADIERRVRHGSGNPVEDAPIGTIYWDITTRPATAWMRQKTEWVKLEHGSREQ